MTRAPFLSLLAAVVASTGLAFTTAQPAAAASSTMITGRASVRPEAVESTVRGDAEDGSVSGDGRAIVFATTSTLVPEDTDAVQDVYVKDLLTDGLERISVTPNGSPAQGNSFAGVMSDDRRFVVFWSWATNLVPGDTNGKADVFVRDRLNRTTERVSVTTAEAQANGASPSIINGDSLGISDDGRYVTFTSSATNLGPDANTLSDVFVRDRTAGTTTLVSVSSAEVPGTSDSYAPSITSDGRYIVFESDASNLVAPDTNSGRDVYVRDRTAGTTIRASLADNDTQPAGQSFTGGITSDGNSVVFASTAKMTPADTNNSVDVYVRTLSTGKTRLVSTVSGGSQAAGDSDSPRIAENGGTIAFLSSSTTILAGANGARQLYVARGSIERASVSTAGVISGADVANPSVDDDGQVVTFDSKAANLVAGDTGQRDVFFRRRYDIGRSASLDAYAAEVSGDFGFRTPAALATAMRAGASPEHLTLVAASSPGFAGKRPPIIRLYWAYFLRLPDTGGLAFWTNKYAGGTSLDQISASFAASSEFTNTYGSKTNSQFVTLIYQNIFTRLPDAGGLAYWTQRLDHGTSRGTVMNAFSESSEGRRKLQPVVDLALFPLGLDGALPTPSNFAVMLSVVDQNDAAEAAVSWLIAP